MKALKHVIRRIIILNYILDKLKLTTYQKRRRKYDIGEHTYIQRNTVLSPNAHIGKYCSIADYAVIGIGDHPTNTLSTSPFQYMYNNIQALGNIVVPKSNLIKREAKKIFIGNDVWIGYRAFIKAGIKIGDGAVIGAGAVVTKDVEPYAIVGGVPAKLIKYRFDENIRKELLELKWWDLPEKFIANLPFEDIRECIKKIKKYKEQGGK